MATYIPLEQLQRLPVGTYDPGRTGRPISNLAPRPGRLPVTAATRPLEQVRQAYYPGAYYWPDEVGLFGLKKKLKKLKKKAGRVTKKAGRVAKRAVKQARAVRRAVTPKVVRQLERKATRVGKRTMKKYGAVVDLAATGASFVPGIGTGVAAGLKGAQALARGQSLAQAAQAAALGAVPGGALAQAAFRGGMALAQGKRLSQAALAAGGTLARGYGGELGESAFRTGLATARGQRVDRALKAEAMRKAGEYAGRYGGAAGKAGLQTALAIGRGKSAKAAVRESAERLAGEYAGRYGGAAGRTGLQTALAIGRGQNAKAAITAGARRVASQYAQQAVNRAAANIPRGRPMPSFLSRAQRFAPQLTKPRRLPLSAARTASQFLRPATDADPASRIMPRRVPVVAKHHTVRLAEAAIRKTPTLGALGAKKAAAKTGLPVRAFKEALRSPVGLSWRGMSTRAAGLVRARAPRVPLGLLSRWETTGLAADGKTYTVESGDYGVKIAQKLIGDGSRWRELRAANPQIAGRPDPNNYGMVIYPGDVLKLPASWISTPAEVVTTAAIVQAKAGLVAWSTTDGANQAGLSDYGQRTEDLTPTWTDRDKFMLTSFSQWWNSQQGADLSVDGNLTQRHLDALTTWAESRAGTLPTPPVQPPVQPPIEPPVLPPGGGVTPPVQPPIDVRPPTPPIIPDDIRPPTPPVIPPGGGGPVTPPVRPQPPATDDSVIPLLALGGIASAFLF